MKIDSAFFELEVTRISFTVLKNSTLFVRVFAVPYSDLTTLPSAGIGLLFNNLAK